MSRTQATQLEDLQRLVRERDDQIRAIQRITGALGSIVKQQDLIREALEVSMELVDAGAGSIILFDEDTGKLVFTHVVGPRADQLVGMELDPDQGIAGAVFRSGELRISEDVSTEKDHDAQVGEKVHYLTKNMVTVPLKSVEGESIGVMQVLNKADGIFEESDVNILSILGAQIASAVETSRLHEQARLAEVIQFIGHISHDVKNMVTPVQTGAETLQFMLEDMFLQLDALSGNGDSEWRDQLQGATCEVRDFYPEMISIIVDGSTNVQERTKEISDCIKGMISKPVFAPVDINALIRRVIKPLSLVAEDSGVTLDEELAEGLPPVTVDEKQLYNAIYNLVNNAIQACEEGDCVTISSGVRVDKRWPEGECAWLAVADTGSGIPDHVRAKLFTDDAISTKPGGTGLGTRIIGNVVRAHGGMIDVESEIGEGTVMTVKIPLTREESG
ncbi:MAG: GAF domain-containing protein [candidate division WS1 bacterium]|jgi:signal transduction histidine kinase|nr:GAF domain-containing protein [candidate division WS1 bacterium]